MKIYIITLTLLITASCAFAQTNPGNSPYLFPAFVKASVLQKGGGVTEAEMNYNTLTEEMLFMEKGEKLVMDLAETVDTIYLGGKKFIPFGKVYYDKLTDTKVALYEQHVNLLQGHAKNANLEEQSNNTVTGSYMGLKNTSNNTGKYALVLSDGYTLYPQNHFWLQKGKSFYSADGVKKIAKVFPDKEQTINDYITTNKLDIAKADDLAKLIVFLNK